MNSMKGRAILAVLLTVGFYALALGIVVALLAFAWLLWVNGQHVNRLTVFCVVGAALILWSIIPRPERFRAPGPLLDAAANPRLFHELTDVATKIGEPMPHEVYLVPDVNAGVRQRGGFMGFGGRRVMLLGLPLLQVLTISEMRAVLTHEFGHYHGGDTRLAPWIYKTREAIGRTIGHLASQSSLLHLPFLLYGRMFLRVTQAVSRQQEYAADALAARVVGARPLISGLRKVFGAALAFDSYWREEVVPIVRAGYLPPIAGGFSHFLEQPQVESAIVKATQEELSVPRVDLYDSHPSLPDRIKALESMPLGAEPAGEPAALSLLADAAAAEPGLVSTMLKPGSPPLRPVSWQNVGPDVLIPLWQARVQREAQLVTRQTVADIPRLIPPGSWDEESRRLRVGTIGAALAVALARSGWTLESLPGESPVLRRGSETLEAFRMVHDLAVGALSPDAWQSRCSALGISGLQLQ